MWGRAEVKEGLTSRPVVQDHAAAAAMNRKPAVVVDKATLFELLHERTDPPPGCADSLRQTFLIVSEMDSLGPALLAKMSQPEENPSQTLLAGGEKLID